MNKQLQKKASQLGMNPSTASGALKKALMFHLVVRCGMDICYQCKEKIETSKELSVEHKVPWLDSADPVGLYFDLDNIAFSHLSCNARAARTPSKGQKSDHGTANRYTTHGCRCTLCVENMKTYRAERYTKAKRQEKYVRTGH